MEGSAFGIRWIVELLREGGVPIHRFVATGGLPHHNRAIVEVYADVLGSEIEIHPSTQGPAIGAAVLGMIAAGPQASGFDNVIEASKQMASAPDGRRDIVYPRSERTTRYDQLYQDYRRLAALTVGASDPN
jgi:L-ribulokinase